MRAAEGGVTSDQICRGLWIAWVRMDMGRARRPDGGLNRCIVWAPSGGEMARALWKVMSVEQVVMPDEGVCLDA